MAEFLRRATSRAPALTAVKAAMVTHRFRLDQILDAYDTFGHAAPTRALKVVIAA
jgi:hypothetical protein